MPLQNVAARVGAKSSKQYVSSRELEQPPADVSFVSPMSLHSIHVSCFLCANIKICVKNQ